MFYVSVIGFKRSGFRNMLPEYVFRGFKGPALS